MTINGEKLGQTATAQEFGQQKTREVPPRNAGKNDFLEKKSFKVWGKLGEKGLGRNSRGELQTMRGRDKQPRQKSVFWETGNTWVESHMKTNTLKYNL